MPHISLVFREMWDTTSSIPSLCILNHCRLRAVVSHISRKTSEMWGTRDLSQIRKVFDKAVSAVFLSAHQAWHG